TGIEFLPRRGHRADFQSYVARKPHGKYSCLSEVGPPRSRRNAQQPIRRVPDGIRAAEPFAALRIPAGRLQMLPGAPEEVQLREAFRSGPRWFEPVGRQRAPGKAVG